MGNPLALLGLIAVIVPIIIHLLGRYQSRVERFPTLQFIGFARLTPRSRLRLSDWKLLLVRMAIVMVAALALTQPGCSSGPEDFAQIVTRVVIVDTSASMFRLTPSGPAASVVARQAADRESMGIADTRRIETGSPASALPGAIAWLDSKPGMRELVIVSDFQRGTLDSTDLAAIPATMGLTLSAVNVIPSAARDLLSSGQKQIPRSARDDNGQIPRSARDDIVVYAGPSDASGADASWRAIGRPRPTDTTGRIAIIYRNAAQATRLHNQAVPIDSPWMARVITTLQRDAVLSEAAADAAQFSPGGPDTVAVNRSGRPVLIAGRNGGRLQFELADAGSLFSAAFNAALVRAVAPMTPDSESDSISWTAEDIARWQRPATAVAGKSPISSDGRWLWLACLGLIGLETYVRSRTRAREAVA